MKPDPDCKWCDVGEGYVCFYCETYENQKANGDAMIRAVKQINKDTREEEDGNE
jgi:hypothetical protein